MKLAGEIQKTWSIALSERALILMIAGIVLLLLLGTLITLKLRKRKKDNTQVSTAAESDLTGATMTTAELQSTSAPPYIVNSAEHGRYHLALLQGIGAREEQQDAIVSSELTDAENKGLLLVLCDGMGGLSHGREIAESLCHSFLHNFPYENLHRADKSERDLFFSTMIPDWLARLSLELYERYAEGGGSTVILAYIDHSDLLFASVGDSPFYLIRGQRIYLINQLHEHRLDLYQDVIEGQMTLLEAHENPRKDALTAFMGQSRIRCDYSERAFKLRAKDRLLLASDGISDCLNQGQLSTILAEDSIQTTANTICREIELKQLPNQDNYSALLLEIIAE